MPSKSSSVPSRRVRIGYGCSRRPASLEFFDTDQASGRSYEMKAGSDPFDRRLTDLGLEISSVLRNMRKARSVFLGTASAPLLDQRERIRQELEARDYRVLTPAAEPVDDARGIARAAVKESALSILFDARTDRASVNPSDTPAIEERTVAMEEGARQLVVLRGQPDETSQPWREIATTDDGSKVEWLFDPPIHTLHHTVLQMLGTPAEPGERPQRLVRVYLICDRQDHPLLLSNRARNLRDHMLRLGFEVKVPLAEGDDAAEFSRDNRDKLRQCDGVLLYWGSARQSWFDQRLGELMQARGWRHGREFRRRRRVCRRSRESGQAELRDARSGRTDQAVRRFRSRRYAAHAVSRTSCTARMTETTVTAGGSASQAGNPFPGLRPFEPHESALFFGRDEQCDALLTRLGARPSRGGRRTVGQREDIAGARRAAPGARSRLPALRRIVVAHRDLSARQRSGREPDARAGGAPPAWRLGRRRECLTRSASSRREQPWTGGRRAAAASR